MKKTTGSHVHGKAAAANHAAVPPPRAYHIHFDWFEDAGNIAGMENR
jgi:hypothetical protein